MKVKAENVNALAQMPKLVVSVRDNEGNNNALVVGYCGNCSFDPAMIMVGIVPSRHSHHMIKENGCFVAHLLDASQTKLYDCCGTESGKNGDKLKKNNIKITNGQIVNASIIEECPVAIECTVVDSIMTGSHEMFIGKIEYVHADKELLNEKGRVDLAKLNLI